jgi:hypothetical protein
MYDTPPQHAAMDCYEKQEKMRTNEADSLSLFFLVISIVFTCNNGSVMSLMVRHRAQAAGPTTIVYNSKEFSNLKPEQLAFLFSRSSEQ